MKLMHTKYKLTTEYIIKFYELIVLSSEIIRPIQFSNQCRSPCLKKSFKSMMIHVFQQFLIAAI